MRREVTDRSQVDRNPSRPRNRTKITRRMMDALLRIGKAPGGVLRDPSRGPSPFNINPRTLYALHDAGLATDYVVVINWPDGPVSTHEVAITDWGRLLLDAFGHGYKRGQGRFYS